MAWNRYSEGVEFQLSSASADKFHSFNTWGLILESDDIGFPNVSGTIDKLDGFYGRQVLDFRRTYGRRTLVFNFGCKIDERWPSLIRTITAAIHGNKCMVVRDCENSFYYIGRAKVKAWQAKLGIGKIRIEVDAEPFKYATTSTTVTATAGTGADAGNWSLNCISDFPTDAIISTVLASSADYMQCDILNYPKGDYQFESKILNVSGTIVIDGINKRVRKGNTNILTSCENLSRFPTLIPGLNTISYYPSSLSVSSVTVTYRAKSI